MKSFLLKLANKEMRASDIQTEKQKKYGERCSSVKRMFDQFNSLVVEQPWQPFSLVYSLYNQKR
jgi:hypothetical protein